MEIKQDLKKLEQLEKLVWEKHILKKQLIEIEEKIKTIQIK